MPSFPRRRPRWVARIESECPVWLKRYSRVLRAVMDEEDDPDDPDDPDEPPFMAALPVCDEDEPDARVMHSVLRAWDVSFDDMVLHTPFLQLWFALPETERRAMIEEEGNMVYFHELDADKWLDRMLEREDADMCRAVLSLHDPATPDPRDVRFYAQAGAIECLQVLQTTEGWTDAETRTRLQERAAMAFAAARGQIPMLHELRRRGLKWDQQTCAYAAAGRQLATLQFLRENRCPWGAWTLELAAANESVDCLRYALANGCPGANDVCPSLATFGNLVGLECAHENGLPWDEATCTNAALAGKLECLKYAHEHGCPWNADTTLEAAEHGHKKEFMYAYQNGCPMDARRCYQATRSKELKRFLKKSFPQLRLET